MSLWERGTHRKRCAQGTQCPHESPHLLVKLCPPSDQQLRKGYSEQWPHLCFDQDTGCGEQAPDWREGSALRLCWRHNKGGHPVGGAKQGLSSSETRALHSPCPAHTSPHGPHRGAHHRLLLRHWPAPGPTSGVRPLPELQRYERGWAVEKGAVAGPREPR